MSESFQSTDDLSRAIERLLKQHKDNARTLEEYLLAVLSLSVSLAGLQRITLVEFFSILSGGFVHDPLPFNEQWRDRYDQLPDEAAGYRGWHATVIQQIVDLREMDECGTLKDKTRHLGVVAPRDSDWYNFDPSSYLECAMEGSFDRWNLSKGRAGMPTITWQDFKVFVICGQIYE